MINQPGPGGDDTGGGGGGSIPTPPTPPPLPPGGLTCQMIADVLKGGITEVSPAATITSFFNTCSGVAKALDIAWFVDSGLSSAQAANTVRSAIISRIERGVEVCAIGAARGYLLPDDPLPVFEGLNRSRQLFRVLRDITKAEQDVLTVTIADLVEIADAYDAGTVTFDRSSPASQLSFFEVSVDGMSTQSGNALADILGYQPDGDFVKRKRALDSLAKLDFSKRKTYLLFTADVITGGRRENGTIICWVRMRDASGYNVTKRDVFGIVDFPRINLSNEFLQRSTSELMADPEFAQIMGFYDWINPGDVFAFVDDSTRPDTLYSFSVSGVQRRAPASSFIFDIPMNALYLSAAQVEAVRSAIQAEVGEDADIDSVSPYPALAQVVYGDAGYGWILAGCNVLASRRRGDSPDKTRSMTYVGSRASDLLAEVVAGRVSVPSDVGQVHQAIDGSIASYGVSQTILTVLDGVGMTQFASGKDDPLGIRPTQESLEKATGGLAKILGTVDPQSATIDPRKLAAALSANASSGITPRYVAAQVPVTGTPSGSPSLEQALGTDVIDLTTYDGIARLMHILRTIYDFYPGALT